MAPRGKQAAEAMNVCGRAPMLWTEYFLVDRQCAFVEWQRLIKVPLALDQKTKAAQVFGRMGMFGTERLLPDHQSTFLK